MIVKIESQGRCTQSLEHPCFCIGLIFSEDYVGEVSTLKGQTSGETRYLEYILILI
jgi:hypothetical protein